MGAHCRVHREQCVALLLVLQVRAVLQRVSLGVLWPALIHLLLGVGERAANEDHSGEGARDHHNDWHPNALRAGQKHQAQPH